MEHNIEKIAIELPTGGAKSSNAIRAMAMISAVSACLIEAVDVDVDLFTPMDVKKRVRQNLRLDKKAEITKEIIMAYVRDNYDFDFPKAKCVFEHIADAVIVGECEHDRRIPF